MRYQFSGVVRGAQPVSPRPPVPCRHRDVQCHGLPPSLLGNVTHRLEPEDDGDNVPSEFNHDGRALETLSPGGEAPYGLALYVGVAPQVRCIVEWEDSLGSHENRTTIRFF